eukprot:scaffold2747_cov104-Cylindrotheca_fusiformis.AAC.13
MDEFRVVSNRRHVNDHFLFDDDDDDDDDKDHSGGGFCRLVSYRNLQMNNNDASKLDSKKSLLSRSINKLRRRSIHHASSSAAGGGGVDGDDPNYSEEEIYLEFEVLKAQLRAAESAVKEKQTQIKLLNKIVEEKDGQLEALKKQLLQASTLEVVGHRHNRRPNLQRRSSLEDIRNKKRMLENVHHTYGLTRSPDFNGSSRNRGSSTAGLSPSSSSLSQSARPHRQQKKRINRITSLDSTLSRLALLEDPLQSPNGGEGQRNATFDKKNKPQSEDEEMKAKLAKLRIQGLTSPNGRNRKPSSRDP